MSESESVVSSGTGGQDSLVTGSEVSGTTLPLVMINSFQDNQQRHQVNTLTNLPSHRFRYSVWHDLWHTYLKGGDLKAPRVRDGPAEKEEFFYKIRDENDQRVHHTKKGKDRKDYRDKTENWENAETMNLSYQDLGQKYQQANFIRILKRLIRSTEITLIDDRLIDLSGITFPCCVHLNLSRNYINSLEKLPKMPQINTLNLFHNDIPNLNGIGYLRKTKLEHLILKGNPVTFSLNYRQNVFYHLPDLKTLDGLKKMPSDGLFDADYDGKEHYDQEKKTQCIVM